MSDKSLTWFGVFINRPLQFGGVKGRLVVVDVSRQHLHRSVTKLPWLGGLVLGHHRELVVGSAVGCVTVQGFDDKELACDWVDVEVLVGRFRAVALQGVADVVAAVCVTVRGLHLMHRATDAMSKRASTLCAISMALYQSLESKLCSTATIRAALASPTMSLP